MVRRGTERVLVRADSRGEMVGTGSRFEERKVVEGGRGGAEMFQSLIVLSVVRENGVEEVSVERKRKYERGRKRKRRRNWHAPREQVTISSPFSRDQSIP